MSLTTLSRPAGDDVPLGRPAIILAAAERCIIRHGFHRATMHDVAAEAGMSAGNVYRYFPSKDAIVEALVARESAALASDLDGLSPDDAMGSFAQLVQRQVVEAGRDKAVLWLEICAEATRNPVIAAVTATYERAVVTRLTGVFATVLEGRKAGGARPSAEAVARLVLTLMSGLMTGQACSPDRPSLASDVASVLATVSAALEGRIPLAACPPCDGAAR